MGDDEIGRGTQRIFARLGVFGHMGGDEVGLEQNLLVVDVAPQQVFAVAGGGGDGEKQATAEQILADGGAGHGRLHPNRPTFLEDEFTNGRFFGQNEAIGEAK